MKMVKPQAKYLLLKLLPVRSSFGYHKVRPDTVVFNNKNKQNRQTISEE